MDTSKLKKFAQYARRSLIEQVESKLKLVLAEESEASREYPQAVADLKKKLAELSQEQLIEQVAYTWFNRFCALRFMDVNQYNRIMVISPLVGQFQPEILAEAKAGHIDEGMVHEKAREKIFGLLSGSVVSRDGQAEAFRLLIVAVCNDLNRIMPYLFERIEDYTELLMPDDLLSGNSILAYTREAMTPKACESVESIGWLYQFYISEKKDEVFDGLKKNKKITPENIPAATQLFTPHWIVRYLVENSLGRLWLLNNPHSGLAAKMDYYIAPEEPETDFPKITKPEEIRICDPAAGSGHMLTYAFDLLYAIYEEEGYDATEIPALILTHNLTGVEIDDRAGALAAFALAMKAAAKLGRRRFLRMEAKPDICVLQNVSFTEAEMQDVANLVGKDLFTGELRETLCQFEQAKNFGSLIVPKLRDPAETLRVVEARDSGGDLLLREVQERVIAVLHMAEALSPKYHVVVANPPYMGAGGMNDQLTDFAFREYETSRFDLLTMFMERCIRACAGGFVGMINLPSWLFLSSFEAFRQKFLETAHINSLLHMGRGIFGIDWGSVAFVVRARSNDTFRGEFFRLHTRNFQYIEPFHIDEIFRNSLEEPSIAIDLSNYDTKHGVDNCIYTDGERGAKVRFQATSLEFEKIPGTPLAYWFSAAVLELFEDHETLLGQNADLREGLTTGDNELFLRAWHEVSLSKSSLVIKTQDTAAKWFPHRKGGSFRRWFGNNEIFINWGSDGATIKSFEKSNIRALNKQLRAGLGWSRISSGQFSLRWYDEGQIFDSTGPSMFLDSDVANVTLAFLNSKAINLILSGLSPTLDYRLTNLSKLPLPVNLRSERRQNVETNTVSLVKFARSDWDAYETSWDFTTLPLLLPDHRTVTLEGTYTTLRAHWQGMTEEMQRLEQENNRIFIDAYGLQDELTPEVPLNEITLTCNPAYRYGVKDTEAGRETRLRADTMAEFLSYTVGCMLGRYSLDKEGLILANQGDTLEDYLKQVPQPSFMPDDDNVIPLIDFDGDWFEDDITERFKEFLKVTFGEENFSENLAFIEEALGGGDGKRKDIKKFFLKDFYTDHVKRYKKRPIYWMFSSPKGSFNALIYMHRYNKDTVSIVLNDYLREFRTKLQARKESHEQIEVSASASAKEKTQAMKAIQKINKVLDEINDYEHETLYPLAGKPPEIDLDDGVKHNYPLFGKALKKITGLS